MSDANDPWAKFNQTFRPDLAKAAPTPPKLPPPPAPAAPPKLPPPPNLPPPPKLPPPPAAAAPAILRGAAPAAPPAPAPVTNRWQQWLSLAGEVASVVGSALAASGYKPMQAKPGARPYEPGSTVRSASSLPPRVDLRPHLTPVEDQGALSSCTANAVAASYEYWVKRWTSQDFDVSRLFIYYNARWRNNEQDKDAGSVIQLAMEGLQNFGSCAEATWPYQKSLVLQKPNAASYEEGARNLVQDTRQVPVDLTAWKQCLAEGNPIVFGALLFDTFDEASKRGGVVPMPTPNEVGRSSHAAHAMTAVGYSESEGVFIVRNSWGTQWGDAGYCYIPYNYLMNSKFNLGDSWIFVPSREKSLPAPNDSWHMDEKPVTNGGHGVDFDANIFRALDYENVQLDVKKELDLLPWSDFKPEQFEKYAEFVGDGKFDALDSFKLEDIEGFDPSNIEGIPWEENLDFKNDGGHESVGASEASMEAGEHSDKLANEEHAESHQSDASEESHVSEEGEHEEELTEEEQLYAEVGALEEQQPADQEELTEEEQLAAEMAALEEEQSADQEELTEEEQLAADMAALEEEQPAEDDEAAAAEEEAAAAEEEAYAEEQALLEEEGEPLENDEPPPDDPDYKN